MKVVHLVQGLTHCRALPVLHVGHERRHHGESVRDSARTSSQCASEQARFLGRVICRRLEEHHVSTDVRQLLRERVKHGAVHHKDTRTIF